MSNAGTVLHVHHYKKQRKRYPLTRVGMIRFMSRIIIFWFMLRVLTPGYDVPHVIGASCSEPVERAGGVVGASHRLGAALHGMTEVKTPSIKRVAREMEAVAMYVGDVTGTFVAGVRGSEPPLEELEEPLEEPETRFVGTSTDDPILVAAEAAYAAGWRGKDLVEAVALAGPESSYDPTAENPVSSAKGMWQTMMSYHAEKYRDGESWSDPFANARVAYQLWEESGWQPWPTYADGSYRPFLDEAREAVAQLAQSSTVEPISCESSLVMSATGVVWPVPGKKVSTYGAPGQHDGVDINRGTGDDDYGDPIRAVTGGVVTYAGWGKGYGKAIFITTPDGFQMRYGHTSTLLVKTGDEVQTGELIGRVGDTGRSTAPHLHLTVIWPGEDEGTYEGALAYLRGEKRIVT